MAPRFATPARARTRILRGGAGPGHARGDLVGVWQRCPAERSTATVPQADPAAQRRGDRDRRPDRPRAGDDPHQGAAGGAGHELHELRDQLPALLPLPCHVLTGSTFNHGVVDNIGPDGGYYQLDNRNTLPRWLQRAGYATGLRRHYLYRYGTGTAPRCRRAGTAGSAPSTRARSGIRLHRQRRRHPAPVRPRPRTTRPTSAADRAVEEIHRLAEGRPPVLLNFWTPGPPVAEPEHSDEPTRGRAGPPPMPGPSRQDWWTADQAPSRSTRRTCPTKPVYVQLNGRFPAGHRSPSRPPPPAGAGVAAGQDPVGRIVDAPLDRTGELVNTVIAMFYPDNGYLQGEHRFRDAKSLPYEEPIRVPLIIRGPGFPPAHHRATR